MTSASDSPQVGVIVKPLEWVHDSLDSGWWAESILGSYRVFHGSRWRLCGGGDARGTDAGSEASAKAAAQADYEARILSALDLSALRARLAVPEDAARRARVQPWMTACFGEEISSDRVEHGDRLLEEVYELLQSDGYDPSRALALLDYVWGREIGEPAQEVGGVMVTLAAYCLAHGLNMHEAGETELARVWTKVEKIRAKQAAKPTGSALPQAWPERTFASEVTALRTSFVDALKRAETAEARLAEMLAALIEARRYVATDLVSDNSDVVPIAEEMIATIDAALAQEQPR